MDLPVAARRVVAERTDGACEKCGTRNGEMHFHHIVRRSDGGKDTAENLALLCYSCHHEWHSCEDTTSFRDWLTGLPPLRLMLRLLRHDDALTCLSAIELRDALRAAAWLVPHQTKRGETVT